MDPVPETPADARADAHRRLRAARRGWSRVDRVRRWVRGELAENHITERIMELFEQPRERGDSSDT